MQHRFVIAGLAATFAAPAAVIQPAAAATLFTCHSVTGSAVLSPGLVHGKRAESLSIGPTAPAGPADITLASTSDAGVKGTGGGTALGPKLSADGMRLGIASNFDSRLRDVVAGWKDLHSLQPRVKARFLGTQST